MNLKPHFIALTLICCSLTVFGQYSYTQKLGSLATIALPDTPKIRQVEGLNIYVANYKGVIFMAEASEVHGGFKYLFTANNADSICNNYIKGILESTKASLFYKNKIKINDHDGIEFGYTAELNGQKTYRYQQALYLKDTLLMCGIWSSDSLSKDEQHLKAFFDGFKVRNDKQLSEDGARNFGHKTGKIIAIFTLLCIPALLGLGMVFIIRKLVYRKNKDKSSSV